MPRCACSHAYSPGVCVFPLQSGPTTKLINPNTADERTFTFDYSFWSHDGFEIDERGVNVKKDKKYSD